jgi:hypothetical protein
LKRLLSSYRRYAAHDDALAAAANVLALVVGLNQPFYPLSLYWATGGQVAVSCLTILSTPVFLAVPPLARRSSLAGRVALIVVGTANALFCTKVFGQASGVEFFLAPCILAAALLFRRREQWISLSLIAAIILAFLAVHDRYGPPAQAWSDQDWQVLLHLNAISAAILTGFIGVVVGRARMEDRRRLTPAG